MEREVSPQKETVMKKSLTIIGALAAASCAGLAWAGHIQSSRYFVPSPSMEPTFQFQSQVAVDTGHYKKPGQVKRGDVVIYSLSQTPHGAPFIKRVVGLPGDRVRLFGTSVWVNGHQLPHTLQSRSSHALVFREASGTTSYTVEYQPKPAAPARREATVTVPQGAFFVIGDNRDNSYDSRDYGAIAFTAITAKAVP